jgi:hypothetical protein
MPVSLRRVLMSVALLGSSTVVLANTWIQGTISEIYISAVGNGLDAIYVRGTFQTGCAENGFMLISTDAHFKESYAALLTAKQAGNTVRYLHVYCTSNGYARGNGYTIAN